MCVYLKEYMCYWCYIILFEKHEPTKAVLDPCVTQWVLLNHSSTEEVEKNNMPVTKE